MARAGTTRSQARLTVKLIPLAGAFHTRWPAFNSVHVREAVETFSPSVVCVPLPVGSLASPQWQGTDEVALPLTVVPWARRAGVPLVEIGIGPDDPQDPGDAAAERDLLKFMEQYDLGRRRLAELDAAAAPLRALLSGRIDHRALLASVVPAVAEYQSERERIMDAGPGTGWLAERSALLASRILACAGTGSDSAGQNSGRVAALIPLDYYPSVKHALVPHAEIEEIDVNSLIEPSPEARARSLLDLAFEGGGDDPAALLPGLASLPEPEARFHEANLLFALGHLAEARAKLEALVAGDFSEPYYLPGFALTRLGQLHDLAGDPRAAGRCYRGALALDFTPEAAIEFARAGLANVRET
ncbi:MAG: hypothetical protein KF813_06865 [Trueperaceae bacterium]|nr:hypothetical protein [Trueperaceae bacterium]